jgi:aminopeptidase N
MIMEKNVKPIYLKNYKKPDFDIKTVDLIFDLFEDFTIVINKMKFQKLTDVSDISLDTINLELEELWLNNLKLEESRYIIKDEKLIILNVPKEFTLKIKNKIYPQNNTELEGLYKSKDIFCTQNEPEGFRSITPYLDRPDVMSVFSTTIIADKQKYPILLSNGNKTNCYDFMNSRHGISWYDPHPKPSYLFAIVAGDLGCITDEFTTMSNKNVELNIYCDKGNENKCYHAMNSLKEAMLWDEQKYTREYDLDIYNIVAVDSFNMGAMENKGLNIFNSAYVLADENTATDDNFMAIQSVIAHEYFHNWTGNRITCRDWFQLTLKEGLTVFRDQCFSADLNSTEVQRIKDVKALRDRQFVEDSSPTSHPIQPKSYISMNNFYTATVYEKGSEVIRMLYTLLGKDIYKKATDLYFDTFDGQAVTIQDFLWAMSEASGLDLTQFENWYHKKGTPVLEVEQLYKDNTLTLIFKQNDDFYYPLKVGIIDENGIELKDELLIIDKKENTFIYKNITSKPTISVNRDFSAPIIVKEKNKDFAFLMKHDKNSFNRYEATQNFAIQTIENIMQGYKIDTDFINAYGYILDLDIDLSYKALLLELPSVSTIMQKQEIIDFELIYNAIDSLKLHLAKIYKDKLLSIYKKVVISDIPFRAMRNRVLKLLAPLEDEMVIQLAKKQYKDSINMTLKINALDVLQNISCYDAKTELEDFYSTYKDNTLVMNKYFSILASSNDTRVLQKVIKLQDDDVYDEKVPNLVRSLIGSFAKNYKYFHAKDGSGYKFIAKKIVDIDSINPQMASSLAGAFKVYNKMNLINKKLMKTELEYIISMDSISKNTYEIVDKCYR